MNDFFRFPVSGRFDGSMKLWFLRRRRPPQSKTPKPQNRDGRHSGGNGARVISLSAMKHRLDLSGDYVAATIRAREAAKKSLREAEQAHFRVLQTKLERALLAIIS